MESISDGAILAPERIRPQDTWFAARLWLRKRRAPRVRVALPPTLGSLREAAKGPSEFRHSIAPCSELAAEPSGRDFRLFGDSESHEKAVESLFREIRDRFGAAVGSVAPVSKVLPGMSLVL